MLSRLMNLRRMIGCHCDDGSTKLVSTIFCIVCLTTICLCCNDIYLLVGRFCILLNIIVLLNIIYTYPDIAFCATKCPNVFVNLNGTNFRFLALFIMHNSLLL